MFSDPPFTGYGVVIHNENADVMASFSVRGSKAVDSSEAEWLACRRAIQFVIKMGITDVVIEGDNAMIKGSIAKMDLSGARLGHIFVDIQALLVVGVCMGRVEGIFLPNPPWWVKKNSTQPNPSHKSKLNPHGSGWTYGFDKFLLLLNWVEKKYKY